MAAWNWQNPENLGAYDLSSLSREIARHRAEQVQMDQFAQQQAIAQQQADYTSPKTLYMAPPMVHALGARPIDQIKEAYDIGQQEKIQNYQDAPKRQVIRAGSNEQPQNTLYASQPQQEQQYSGPGRAPANEITQAIEQFSNGLMAKRMGLQVDANGGVYGPGRQVKEYYDLYDRLIQAQASALSASTRPVYQPAPVVIPPVKPNANVARSPYDTQIKDAYNAMKLSQGAVSGVNGIMATPEQQKQAQDDRKAYDELFQKRREYLQNQEVVTPAPKSTNKGASAAKGSKSISKKELDSKLQSGEVVKVVNKKTKQEAYMNVNTKELINVK
jgi:hypothetical protein